MYDDIILYIIIRIYLTTAAIIYIIFNFFMLINYLHRMKRHQIPNNLNGWIWLHVE